MFFFSNAKNRPVLNSLPTNPEFGILPRMSSQRFLKFDYLTLVPMCRKLVDISLLSSFEKQWLDAYHGRVWEELKGELIGFALDVFTFCWLDRLHLMVAGVCHIFDILD